MEAERVSVAAEDERDVESLGVPGGLLDSRLDRKVFFVDPRWSLMMNESEFSEWCRRSNLSEQAKTVLVQILLNVCFCRANDFPDFRLPRPRPTFPER